MKTNGHRSSAVRLYKRTQDAQHVKISEIIQGIDKFKCESEDADKESIKELRDVEIFLYVSLNQENFI